MIRKTPNYHGDPDARQKTEAFEIGMRVKVISLMVDFYAFRGETGTVIENSGRYLGITVRFDEPRRFKGGGIQEQFNFNYYDLEMLQPEPDIPALMAELAALRRQLAEAQANERIALDALDMAIAERDEAYKELDAAQAHLANAAVLPPPRCGDRGFAGHSACSLPAGHDGPHEYRTFMYDHDERVRRLSSRA